MKVIPAFLLLTLAINARSQHSVPVNTIDTAISFFGIKPIDLYNYDNRVVPYGSKAPLYVCINYEGGKFKEKEYFKAGDNKYLLYEYFKNGDEKAQGHVKVTDEITGKSYTRVRPLGLDTPSTFLATHYYKKLSKEGEWTEYSDTFEFRTYWTGQYLDDKKVGIWKQNIQGLGEDQPIQEIDYSKNSTRPVYGNNLAFTLPLDSLNLAVSGYWLLRFCDSKKDIRMIFSKENAVENGYDPVNNPDGFYLFQANNIFTRKRGEGCYRFKETAIKGKWTLVNKTDGRYINIKFSDHTSWTLKLLYLDAEGNLVTERS